MRTKIDFNSDIIFGEHFKIYQIITEKCNEDGIIKNFFEIYLRISNADNSNHIDFLVDIYAKKTNHVLKLNDFNDAFIETDRIYYIEGKQYLGYMPFDKNLFDYNEFFKCEQFTKAYQKWYFEVTQFLNLEQTLLF